MIFNVHTPFNAACRVTGSGNMDEGSVGRSEGVGAMKLPIIPLIFAPCNYYRERIYDLKVVEKSTISARAASAIDCKNIGSVLPALCNSGSILY